MSKEKSGAAQSVVHSLTVQAGPNIAVAKYWGKRDAGPLNLPINSSLSFTLDHSDIHATTTVAASTDFAKDRIWLNGREEPVVKRVATVLRELRKRCTDPARKKCGLRIVSRNSFPTAAGMASSAAGYCALTVAVAGVLRVAASYPGELTAVARMGSGSACRSLLGGLVQWHKGVKADGTDSIATQIQPAGHWPINMTVVVVSAEKKLVSSSSGMQTSVRTSDLLAHRAGALVDGRIAALKAAHAAKDFARFGELVMRDSNQFHATCLDTYPPIFYLNDVSRCIIRVVHGLNAHVGRVVAAYTFDAGSNAFVFSEPQHTALVNAVIAHFFPGENSPKKRTRLDVGVCMAELEARLKMKPLAAGTVTRLYHSKVGGGPRSYSTAELSLMDTDTWLPK